MAGEQLAVVLDVSPRLRNRVQYVLDTLCMALGIVPVAGSSVPVDGPWLYYGATPPLRSSSGVTMAHCTAAWDSLAIEPGRRVHAACEELPTVLQGDSGEQGVGYDIPVDLFANAFYFLASVDERNATGRGSRGLHRHSVVNHLGLPPDIVDRYLSRLASELTRAGLGRDLNAPLRVRWPSGASYAVVLSHDVDYLPAGTIDVLVQGAKSVGRHLLHQRDPIDALRASGGLLKALCTGRDPYGCVPEIIAREKQSGVSSSFQVAVAHRHANDVRYRVTDERVQRYLAQIPAAGFDLCLHGSYRSTEREEWYVEECELLSATIGRPLGSRQHFLSFGYDALFSAQEKARIEYDMSMGFPDATGPRAGFSFPYFPYNMREERPYDVVEISLFLMDVTLRSYLGLKGSAAWARIRAQLDDLRSKGGGASVVWHPIVFGGARDPGDAELYWQLVEYVKSTGGLATNGRVVNDWWRAQARRYSSFAGA